MQAKYQPDYPLLYSLPGFRYCDLLLAEAERAAWQHCLSLDARLSTGSPLESCRTVEQRAEQTLEWAENRLSLPTIALDHLTLGCAALFRAILEQSAIRDPECEIQMAVDGLRRSGRMDCLPRGLLTRAWLRFLAGNGRPLQQIGVDKDAD